eukprot:scaffold111390_cov13-Tisochrysis_lutea.AAC.1
MAYPCPELLEAGAALEPEERTHVFLENDKCALRIFPSGSTTNTTSSFAKHQKKLEELQLGTPCHPGNAKAVCSRRAAQAAAIASFAKRMPGVHFQQ